MKHFIHLKDISTKDLRRILSDAKKRKKNRKKLNTLEIDKGAPLKGKLLVQMFEKSSLRTRMSFYLAIKQLGGGTLTLRSSELHLGQGSETLEDTAKILSERLSLAGSNLIVKVLDTLSGHEPQNQPSVGVTYANKIQKSEAKIDWSLSAKAIDRKIRALSPFPGAWTEVNGERIKLLASKVIDKESEPGVVLEKGFSIACGQKAVEITEAQRPGKSAQKSDDFLRGFRLPQGAKLD